MADLSKLSNDELLQLLATHPEVQKKGMFERLSENLAEGFSKASKGELLDVPEPIKQQQKEWNLKNFGVPDFKPYTLGGKVTDVTGSPEAGVATQFALNAAPALFGYRTMPEQVSATEPVAQWLMKKAVKPATEDVVNKSASKAFATMLREGQLPTQGGMVKAQKIVNQLHPQVEAGFAKSTAEIPIAPIGEKYLEQYSKALPQGEAAVKEVGDAWKGFSQNPLISGSDSMTAQMANILKRGQQDLARANYGKPTGEAQKALAAYLREDLLKTAPPELKALLAREAANMNVLDVARNSIASQSKANPAGLAALRSDAAIPMLGFMADRSPFFKGLLAHLLYQGGRPEMAMPAAAAIEKTPQIFSQE